MLPLANLFKGVTMLSRMDKVQKLIKDNQIKGNPFDNEIVKSLVQKADKKPIFQSKKFWATVLGVLIPLVNNKFGWGLNVQELSAMLAPLMAYIVGQGIADKK